MNLPFRPIQLLVLPGLLAAGLHEWIALWRSRQREARRGTTRSVLAPGHRPTR